MLLMQDETAIIDSAARTFDITENYLIMLH